MSETIGAKVAHVRAASQTWPHLCHWPGCLREVPPALWGCRQHWYKLPTSLRRRIWATYKAGQEITMTPSLDCLEAARDVQAWIANHQS